MIDLIPESHQYLLNDETKAFAWVATVNPDGGPQLTSVWFDTDGEHILFNTTDKSAKYRYLKANPKMAVAIVDPKDPHKYVQIRGKVKLTTAGAVEHTHKLSRKYTGKDFQLRPGFERVKFIVTPRKVTVWPPQR
ncbi:MAG: PPOX class F420-dependent oxidoreductase [Anaerolineales bacterium]